nr:MAG TPA: hypothetical protein [Caudoviricetes sp.]
MLIKIEVMSYFSVFTQSALYVDVMLFSCFV